MSIAFKEHRNLREFFRGLNDLKHTNEDFSNSELFNDILMTPGAEQFIQVCFQQGSNFYKVNYFFKTCALQSFASSQSNDEGFYPIYYAINSLCDKNIEAVIKAGNRQQHELNFRKIINVKFKGRNNYLHQLIDRLTNENFPEISTVIKILIINGCSMNLLNDQSESPICKLFKSSIDLDLKKDLLNFARENSNMNMRLCRQIETILGENETVIDVSEVADLDYMLQQLNDENEEDFLNNINAERFNKSQMSSLLEIAVARNLCKSVELLINYGVDVNELSSASRYGKEPAFLAASLGHIEIFKLLLKQPNLKFQSDKTHRNFLHEILSSRDVVSDQVEELFILIIMDRRCSLNLMNGIDDARNSALYYACHNKYYDVAKELMRRGAFIGADGVIDNLKVNVLESFLDDCLSLETKPFAGREIRIDYQFLIPSHMSEKGSVKTEALKAIANSPNLNPLLKHPVLSSFLDLKWNSIKFFILAITIMRFLCLAYEVWFFAYFATHFYDFDQLHQNICIIVFFLIFVVLTMMEIIQLLTSFKTYFTKLGNWLDIATIGTIFYTLAFGAYGVELQYIAAFLVLIVSFQSVKIVGISIYSTIFRKVCSTFFKLFATYSFLFVTFALSFQVLFNADITSRNSQRDLEDSFTETASEASEIDYSNEFVPYESFNEMIKNWRNESEADYPTFGNIGVSMIRVITMFIGELDSEQFNDPFKMIFLVLFILFMTITLQNLMNSMAIIDTQQIISESELIGLRKRTKLIYNYEKFFSMFGCVCFKSFSAHKFNSYKLDPASRMLTIYVPLDENQRNSKDKDLKLSQNAVEHMSKYLTGESFFSNVENKRKEKKGVCHTVCRRATKVTAFICLTLIFLLFLVPYIYMI